MSGFLIDPSASGGGADTAEIEEAIQTILKDLDGYGSAADLQGLVNTELEHTVQSSDVFQTIRKDLDGYGQTEQEHHTQVPPSCLRGTRTRRARGLLGYREVSEPSRAPCRLRGR